MIVFKKVRYKNYLSTGQQFIEIDLDKAPTTLVVGDNGFLAIQIGSCAGLSAVPQPSHSEVPTVTSSSTS